MAYGPECLLECRYKIGRAQEHLYVLTREISEFLESQPYAVIEEYDREHAQYLFKLKVIRPLPYVGFGLLIGDCVHNLRSALDYIAWRLAGSDLTDKGTLFPIHIRPNDFNSVRPKLHRIHGDAVAAIESVQPYLGENSQSNLLWLLQELDARDKHKLIAITQTTAHGMRLSMDDVADKHGAFKLRRGDLEDGAIVADMSFPDGIPQPEVKVQGFAFEIKIKGAVFPFRRYPVGMLLAQIKGRVEEVVRRFEELITLHPDWIPK